MDKEKEIEILATGITKKAAEHGRIFLSFFFVFFMWANVAFPQYPGWTQYLQGNQIIAQKMIGDTDWIATCTGGLVKWNTATGEKTYFNSANSGLPSNEITALETDIQGAVWVGYGAHQPGFYTPIPSVNKYLVKFDGKTWTQFSVPPGNFMVSCLICDKTGMLWVGSSYYGICVYNGTSWSVHDMSNTAAMTDNIIRAMAMDSSGTVWAATSNELVKCAGASWWVYPVKGAIFSHYVPINCLAIDNNNNKWIGTDSGVVKYTSDTGTLFGKTDLKLTSATILSIMIGKNDSVWIGSKNRSVSVYNGQTWSSAVSLGLPEGDVSSIESDSKGNKMFGTIGEFLVNTGIAVYNGSSTTILNISNTALGYCNVNVVGAHNGIAWLSSYPKGVARFDSSGWKLFLTGSGIADQHVYDIAFDNANGVWFATGDGVSCLNAGGAWTTYRLSDFGITDETLVNAITLDSNGYVWAGTWEGVIRFEKNKGQYVLYDSAGSGLPSNWITELLTDKRGNVWIQTSKGMIVYRNGALQRQSEAGWKIAMDKNGTVWWASPGKLISYDGSAFKTISCNAIPSSNIWKLAVGDDLTKWIATWSGLIKIDSSGASYTYTSQNSGLPHTEAEAVYVDEQMNVWVGTHEGAAMLSKQGYQNKIIKFPSHAIMNETTRSFGMCMPGQKCFNVFIPMPAIAYFRIFNLSGRLITSFSHDYNVSGTYSVPVLFAKSGSHAANAFPFIWRINLFKKD